MSSNAPNTERSSNATPIGGDGLYDSSRVEQAESLKVRLGDHLDSATRGSLQTAQRSSTSILDHARRNPVPVLLTISGIVLLAALTRRSLRG